MQCTERPVKHRIRLLNSDYCFIPASPTQSGPELGALATPVVRAMPPCVDSRALALALHAEGGDAGRVLALFGTSEDALRQASAFEMTVAA